jgi:hypothetical protein
MKEIKIALIGFGSVGQALARLLISKQSFLARQHQLNVVLTGILTAHHGTVINEAGIDLQAALSLAESDQSLQTLPGETTSVSGVDFVRVCHAGIVFENTPVNYDTGEPALSHIKQALKMRKTAITANKGPIVHGYRELRDLALAHGGRLLFESTVMDGAPIFSLWREALPGAELQSFRGVLNSTTNLILTLMEDGHTFDEAVSHAQSIGIAESDPSGDIGNSPSTMSSLPNKMGTGGNLSVTRDGMGRKPTHRSGLRGLITAIHSIRSWAHLQRYLFQATCSVTSRLLRKIQVHIQPPTVYLQICSTRLKIQHGHNPGLI